MASSSSSSPSLDDVPVGPARSSSALCATSGSDVITSPSSASAATPVAAFPYTSFSSFDERTSRSSASVASSAPSYVVEENSKGELVNKHLDVKWPTRVLLTKRYPGHSSTTSNSASSVTSAATSDSEDQFANSMMEIADLDAAILEARENRIAGRGWVTRSSSSASSAASSSPQYVQLSSSDKTSYETDYDTDESEPVIDSIVFDTAEELERYQRIFYNDNAVRSVTDHHFLGGRSRGAVDKKLTPGKFFMYYDKPPTAAADIPVTIALKIAYMSTKGKIYHFPIQRFECEGESYYAVMQTDTEEADVKMFPSIESLVQHYHDCSLADADRLETFGLPI